MQLSIVQSCFFVAHPKIFSFSKKIIIFILYEIMNTKYLIKISKIIECFLDPVLLV